MELKLTELKEIIEEWAILIVPYGIETGKAGLRSQWCRCVLIVPYGIET